MALLLHTISPRGDKAFCSNTRTPQWLPLFREPSRVSNVICATCTVWAVQIKARAAKLGLNCSFQGARDHMDDSIVGYRVFVNASTSDVVATTSAEALAMGKWCTHCALNQPVPIAYVPKLRVSPGPNVSA